MKFKISLSTVILFILCQTVFAQRDSVPLNTIITKMSKLPETHPIEKLYLHFDKPYYAVGDTIWYKAYLTYGLHQPSELSKIVYVDVINSKDQTITTQMLPVKNGTAVGSIPLVEGAYSQDSYHIRAYTRWMTNFDRAYFFHKTIPVGNAINKGINTTISLKRTANTNNAGLNTSIVYTDAEGKPYADKKVQWNITNSGDDIDKGKGTTDAQGRLNISFANTGSVDLGAAVLKTVLDAGNRKTYENAFPLKSAALPADVQFFPEGGNLVNGIRSKIGVKAIQPNGLSTGFSAVITDNTGATITNCNNEHAGMGMFLLTPEAGKTYKAAVTFADGTKEIYELPPAQSNGITLSVSNIDTAKLFIKISVSEGYLKAYQNKTFYLIGKSGQVICYAAKIPLTKAEFQAFIPKEKLPTGIAQLTVLTPTGQPVSERLVFINHRDQLNLAITSDKKLYTSRKKVLMSVSTKGTTLGDLSVAVINESKVPVDEDAETTILSSLLLTSDLKGYVEKPNYYFKQVTDKTINDLDLLLLTQGYRRFTYNEVLKNKIPQITYFPELGIDLSGVLRSTNGMPVKGGTVTLQIPDKYYTTRTTSDAEGRFRFTDLVFTDSARVIVSAKNNYNAKNLMVTVDGVAYPASSANPNEPDEMLNIDTMMTDYLVNSKRIFDNSRTLQEVVIKAKAITKAAPSHADHSALAGLNTADHLITADRFKGCNQLLLCMQGGIAGVTYDNFNFYVTRDYNAGRRVPMAVYVNGMPVDVNYLTSVEPSKLSSIEVFLRDELGLVNRAGQTNGVLVINLKEVPKGTKISMQELEELLPQANVAKLQPMGYSIPKQFYSPKYTLTGNGGAFGPDLRTTIFWNPRVFTDATGKASFDFFTADGKGTYRAVVEGIDKDGRVGRAVYRFKVQ